MEPNPVTFLEVLYSCASWASFDKGRHTHEEIIESDVFVGNSLVNMYAKSRRMENASRVFHRMATHYVVSWTAMILGYVKSVRGQKAFELFHWMQLEGVKPDAVTFVGGSWMHLAV